MARMELNLMAANNCGVRIKIFKPTVNETFDLYYKITVILKDYNGIKKLCTLDESKNSGITRKGKKTIYFTEAIFLLDVI